MIIQKPDYKNSIANLACSVLKEFDVPAPHEGLSLMDKTLGNAGKEKYKNIVVLILDGLGTALIEDILEPDGFFRSHLRGSFSSVFPPTTAASTTSFQSGLFPNEHAWLGWDVYFKEIDKTVTVFRNRETGTGTIFSDMNVAKTFRPYKSVIERIIEAGGQAYSVDAFTDPYPKSFKGIMRQIKKLCSLEGRKFIYGYCEEPDYTLHRSGRPIRCASQPETTSGAGTASALSGQIFPENLGKDSASVIRKLEKRAELICSELHDTLFIITADHGHINTVNYCLEDYPDFTDCLDRVPSGEPRALSVFLKPGREKEFLSVFEKHFKKDFRLYSRDEIIGEELFGPLSAAKVHQAFHDSVGDYVLTAVSDACIYSDRKTAASFRSGHAGMTADEMNIPFIAIECI